MLICIEQKKKKERRRAQDPIDLTRKTLISKGLATLEELEETEKSVAAAISEMLSSVRSDSSPLGKDALKYVFAE